MEYLSMIIGQGLVCMDPTKLLAIKDWQPPSLIKGVHSFLGFANFYWKFILNYSNIVAPMVLLTCKNHPWSWTEPQQNAFDTLKMIFSSAPVLQWATKLFQCYIHLEWLMNTGRTIDARPSNYRPHRKPLSRAFQAYVYVLCDSFYMWRYTPIIRRYSLEQFCCWYLGLYFQ